MPSTTYTNRRSELETYFDRTAVEAWKKLTSDAPVSKIRQTVRAGRDQMRALLLYRMGADLTGQRVLDAGCGTGALAMEAARRGAHVTAIDLSEKLVGIARENAVQEFGIGKIDFRVGDMFDPALGEFDQIVCMDSLIHYQTEDMVATLEGFSRMSSSKIHFTFAPRTPALAVMHAVGQLFPRSNRSPAIVPAAEKKLRRLIAASETLNGWSPVFTQRIASGFYTSQAMELAKG